jgi:hypothetical protein
VGEFQKNAFSFRRWGRALFGVLALMLFETPPASAVNRSPSTPFAQCALNHLKQKVVDLFDQKERAITQIVDRENPFESKEFFEYYSARPEEALSFVRNWYGKKGTELAENLKEVLDPSQYCLLADPGIISRTDELVTFLKSLKNHEQLPAWEIRRLFSHWLGSEEVFRALSLRMHPMSKPRARYALHHSDLVKSDEIYETYQVPDDVKLIEQNGIKSSFWTSSDSRKSNGKGIRSKIEKLFFRETSSQPTSDRSLFIDQIRAHTRGDHKIENLQFLQSASKHIAVAGDAASGGGRAHKGMEIYVFKIAVPKISLIKQARIFSPDSIYGNEPYQFVAAFGHFHRSGWSPKEILSIGSSFKIPFFDPSVEAFIPFHVRPDWIQDVYLYDPEQMKILKSVRSIEKKN